MVEMYRVLILLVCSLTVLSCKGSTTNSSLSDPGPKVSTEKYNFVVILTDDQRWDTLWAMPVVQDRLMTRGVTFSNAFVSTPLCCPSRASLLAGGYYAHNTGVLDNRPPNGSVRAFRDDLTLATLLQKAGYKTALIGKYLNEYRRMPPYVPPGWTKFVTATENTYYDYRITIGSSGELPSQGKIFGKIHQYITDFERDQALEFLEKHADSPFFLLFSTTAPHAPATPAGEDFGVYADYIYRGRAYGEADLTDKPKSVRADAKWYGIEAERKKLDDFIIKQLKSSRAVDRALGAIMDKIAEKGQLERTVFFFASDNGQFWGEHRLRGKERPYEEAIRVPFVILMPGISPRTDNHLVVSNLDIGATIFDLAGIGGTNSDGLSLVPLLKNPDSNWRKEGLIELFCGKRSGGFVWSGLRVADETGQWKYVEYASGGRELYDLVADPYEEENKVKNPGYQNMVRQLSARLDKLKGLAIRDLSAPRGMVGQHYEFRIRAWGGTKPYSWSIVEGQLPEGLILDETTGLISGFPVGTETQTVSVRVQDASVAKQTGLPQSFIQPFSIAIVSPTSLNLTVPENHLAKAQAGIDQVVQPGHSVILDGLGSSDPQDNDLSFE